MLTVLLLLVAGMVVTSTVVVLALCRAAAMGDAAPRPPRADAEPETDVVEEWRRGA